jgi:hypothetical protein
MNTLDTERPARPTRAAGRKDVRHSRALEALPRKVPDLLALLAAANLPGGASAPALRALVAECTDDQHPSLHGRVQVRWTDATGVAHTLWVPALSRLAIRKADRVLMIVPDNWPEPLVVGVVDGFERRTEVPPVAAATVILKLDEALTVRDSNGREVLEITPSENGPNLKLLHPNVNLELPGNLSLKADKVELTARAGPVIIKASDDVVCQGEMIRLN